MVSMSARAILIVLAGAYFLGGAVVGFAEQRNLAIAIALPFVALLTHFAYGVQFLRGLFVRRLER